MRTSISFIFASLKGASDLIDSNSYKQRIKEYNIKKTWQIEREGGGGGERERESNVVI
jgi:hypothetical protein